MRPTTRKENYIHPDIKKFWSSKYEMLCENHETHQDWLIRDGKPRPTRIAIFQNRRISSDLEYKYEDKWYTEEDMLRIVNLSAFM
jgi:hypothetical protein